MSSLVLRPAITVSALCVWSVVFAGGRVAAQDPGSITVQGSGVSSAAPSYVILKGKIKGNGDSAEEAVKQFNKVRAKVEKDVTADESTRLSVRVTGEKLISGVSVSPEGPVSTFGADASTSGGQLAVSATVEMRIDFSSDMERIQAIDRLAEIADKAREAGVIFQRPMNSLAIAMAEFSGNAVVEFGLDEGAKLRSEAYQGALKDARARAESLASLTGAKLGQIVSIEEVEAETQENPYLAAMSWAMQETADSKAPKLTTDRNGDIEVRKDLKVVFLLLND